MPIEAFSCFKYMGTLKHNDQIISSAGQFETILKNKLYRPSRDSDSLCLDQSTARVLIPYDLYDMTHFDTCIVLNRIWLIYWDPLKINDWIKINTELMPYIEDKNISQFGLMNILDWISNYKCADKFRMQKLHKVQIFEKIYDKGFIIIPHPYIYF